MGFAFRMQGSRAKRGPTPSLSTPFVDVTSQALGTVITSNTVQVLNISGGSSIMITGGAALGIGNGTSVEYSINGGTFTSSSGSIDPTDQLQLRITTHASYLRDANQVKVTIAGIGNSLWNVTTIAPAPAMTSIRMGFGIASQYAATRGGTPAITEQITSFNTGTSSTTLEAQGATHGDKNFFTITGLTGSTFPWPSGAGNALIPIFAGTLTNSMYKTDVYTFKISGQILWDGISADSELAQLTWVDDVNGVPAEFDPPRSYLFELPPFPLDWPRTSVTSNSQAVSLYPTFNPDANANSFGPTVGNHADSARYSMYHQGHPSPTTAGSTGQTGNYIQGSMSLTFEVAERPVGLDPALVIHSVTVMDEVLVKIMPAV